jgi:hypothetical protein
LHLKFPKIQFQKTNKNVNQANTQQTSVNQNWSQINIKVGQLISPKGNSKWPKFGEAVFCERQKFIRFESLSKFFVEIRFCGVFFV